MQVVDGHIKQYKVPLKGRWGWPVPPTLLGSPRLLLEQKRSGRCLGYSLISQRKRFSVWLSFIHYLFCLSPVCHNHSVLLPEFQSARKTIQSIKHILSANCMSTACLASSLIICHTCSLSPERWCFAFCTRLVVFPTTLRVRFRLLLYLLAGWNTKGGRFPRGEGGYNASG